MRPTRRLSAIFSADVAGYTRLMRVDEATTVAELKYCRELMSSLVERHSGRVVDTAGDGLLAEFSSAVNAVECGVAVQQHLAEHNAGLREERKMQLRIGVNLGDVLVEDGHVYGDGVNVAARVQGLAEPGGICVSGMVYNQIQHVLDLSCDFLGKQRVENVSRPIPVYRIAIGPEMPRRRRWWLRVRDRRNAIAGSSAAALLLIAVLIWMVSARTDPASPAGQDQISIAVLPFANLSNDPTQEYFSDGVTTGIITELSRLSKLLVIARYSTFTYKGSPVDVRKVGNELNVRYVLDGSVQKAVNRVRISVQLIDAVTGHNLWADHYDRELTDVLAVQDEITKNIVTTLSVRLTEEEQRQLSQRYTANIEAYDYFLQGQAQFLLNTKESHRRARKLFQQAIGLDPNFARAIAALAMVHLDEFRFKWSADSEASRRLAHELAERAVALDKNLAHGHGVLAFVHLYSSKRYDQAVKEAGRAIDLDPDNADGHAAQASSHIFNGDPARAIPLMHKAMRLNPHYQFQYPTILGLAYYHVGRYEEAVAALQDAINRNYNRLSAHIYLAASLSDIGKLDEANWEVEQILSLDPDFTLEKVDKAFPIQRPEQVEQLKKALRRAGLN